MGADRKQGCPEHRSDRSVLSTPVLELRSSWTANIANTEGLAVDCTENDAAVLEQRAITQWLCKQFTSFSSTKKSDQTTYIMVSSACSTAYIYCSNFACLTGKTPRYFLWVAVVDQNVPIPIDVVSQCQFSTDCCILYSDTHFQYASYIYTLKEILIPHSYCT